MVLKHLLVSTTSLGNVTSVYDSAAHCLLGVKLQQKHLSERELLLHCQSSSRQTGHIFCKRNFQLHLPSYWLMIPDLVHSVSCNVVQKLSIPFFARDSIYAKRAYAIAIPSIRPSVRLSVTRVDQSKTVEVRIMQFSPYSSPIPLVFVR